MQFTQQPAVEKPHSNSASFSVWKASLLSACAIISAFFAGYFLKAFFIGAFEMGKSGLWFGIAATIFFALISILVMFVNRKKWLAIVGVISAVVIIAPFVGEISVPLAFVGVIIILIFAFALVDGRKELDNHLTIHFFRMARSTLSRIVIGIALLVGVLFFNTFSFAPLTGDNPILPQGVFEKSIAAFSSKLKPILGDVDFSKSLHQISSEAINGAFEESGLSSDTAATFTSTSQKQLVDEYERRITSVIGEPIDPEKPLSTAIYEVLLNKFNKTQGATKTTVLVGLSFVLFLSIAAVGPIIRFIAALVGFIIFEILLAIGFGEKIYDTVSKETVVLS